MLCDSCKAAFKKASKKGRPQPPDIDVIGAVLKEAAVESGFSELHLDVPTKYPEMFKEMAKRHDLRCTQITPTIYRFTRK